MKRAMQVLGLCFLTLLISPLATSDTLGLYLGAGTWGTDVEGSAREAGTGGSLEIGDTFGSVEEDNNFFYLALEHPVPVIPNILVQQTDVSVDESGSMVVDVVFDGDTFTAGTDVNTTIDFSHTDATFYYELLDNWVSLDLGLTVRMFDGELTLTESATPVNTATQVLDGALPMLYLKARFDLPLSGFYVGAHANALTYDGHSLTDFTAAAGYQTDGWVMDLGVEFGIRTFTFELDDLDELDADIELSGSYFAVTVHF